MNKPNATATGLDKLLFINNFLPICIYYEDELAEMFQKDFRSGDNLICNDPKPSRRISPDLTQQQSLRQRVTDVTKFHRLPAN
jgi:hypothetical protein